MTYSYASRARSKWVLYYEDKDARRRGLSISRSQTKMIFTPVERRAHPGTNPLAHSQFTHPPPTHIHTHSHFTYPDRIPMWVCKLDMGVQTG